MFAEDDYEEVATKVTGALTGAGVLGRGLVGADREWDRPQARKRLVAKVMEEVFEQVTASGGHPDVGGVARSW